MAQRPLKRPTDSLALAKLIGDIATGRIKDEADDGKNPSNVERGKSGGLVGGRARAAKLTPEKRRRIAQKAAGARWKTKKQST